MVSVDPSVSDGRPCDTHAAMSDTGTVAPIHTRAMHGLRLAVIDERDGPLPAMLVALTVLAGIVDATSILKLGHVFVATMTGNLVFVGLAIAGAKGFAIVPCLLSIGGFIAGALVGGRACRASHGHRGRALRNVLDVKLVLATVVAVLAITHSHLSVGIRDTIIVLLAASMGCQLAAIRFLKVPDLLTVVLTLTITGVLTERGLGLFHPAMMRRGVAVLAFAVGAIGGAVLVLNLGLTASLAVGLTIIIGVAIAAHRASFASGDWTAPH
jgi:uncharacterized membrane protein YoaK (UPF0700 family)